MIDYLAKPVKSKSIMWQLKAARVFTLSVLAACLLFPVPTSGAYGPGGSQHVRTVVIDPGHGGHDSGCLGHTRVNEKEVALNIALMLGGYINQYLPDVKVIYTRSTDVFVELEERAAIANRNHADLFISIHCNAASPAAFGAETYVMGLHKNQGNLDVAKRENSVMKLEDNYEERYAFDPNSVESYIMLSLTQDAYQEQSTKFAALVQEQFRERVGRHDRGVKSAGFWVLWRTAMPSVLIETGFLTNADEERFLNSKQGQEYMASAIFRALRDYKEEIERTTTALETMAPPQETKPVSAPVVKPLSEDAAASAPRSYRVQLLVSSQKHDSFSKKFREVDQLIVEYLDNGLFRYSAGPYATERDALLVRDKMRTGSFRDAFVAVYEGADRIAVVENDKK